MKYLLRELYYFFISLLYRIKSRHLKIEYRAKIAPKSRIEGFNKLCHHSYFSGDLGFGSYIGDNSIVIGKVGRFCSIASNVVFLTKTHPVDTFVSTHPAFYSLKKQSGFTFAKEQTFNEELDRNDKKSITIGNDVYIGYGATIIGPVHIGDGAVVAANATVTKDVPPYTVVAGTPARIVRKRFSDDQISFLCDFKWWEKDVSWIKGEIDNFQNIDFFIDGNK